MNKLISGVLFIFLSVTMSVQAEGITYEMWDAIRKDKLIKQYGLSSITWATYRIKISQKVREAEAILRLRGISLSDLKDFTLPEVRENCESILYESSSYGDAYLVYTISEKEKFSDLKKLSAESLVSSISANSANAKKHAPFIYSDINSSYSLNIPHRTGKGSKLHKPSIRFTNNGFDFSFYITESKSKGSSVISQRVQMSEKNEFDKTNMKTIGHCLNLLSSVRGISKPLIIKYSAIKRNSSLDPLSTFIRLDNAFDKNEITNDYVYLGDLNPQGDILKWGYLRDLYGSKKEKLTVLLSPDYYEQLLDLSRVSGVSVVTQNCFFGVKNIKDALAIQKGKDKNFEQVKKEYLGLISSFSSTIAKPDKASTLSSLDRILKKSPNFLSAKVLKIILLGKLPKKISYKSSYLEASYFARRVINRQFTNTEDISTALKDLKSVEKYFHADFQNMMKYTSEAMKDMIKLSITPQSKAPKSKNKNILTKSIDVWSKLNQKIYRYVRLIRFEREKLLDRQRNVERLY